MENKRRFSRLACDENIVIKFKENFVEATLVEISLKGALVQFKEDLGTQVGDCFQLLLTLKESNDVIQFKTEVIYNINNYIGVKFVLLDIESFMLICRFLEARTNAPQQIRHELDYLVLPDFRGSKEKYERT